MNPDTHRGGTPTEVMERWETLLDEFGVVKLEPILDPGDVPQWAWKLAIDGGEFGDCGTLFNMMLGLDSPERLERIEAKQERAV